MFESFRLQVRYDKVASWATCHAAIREEALDQLLTDSSSGQYRLADQLERSTTRMRSSQRKRTIQTKSVPFWLVPRQGTNQKGTGATCSFATRTRHQWDVHGPHNALDSPNPLARSGERIISLVACSSPASSIFSVVTLTTDVPEDRHVAVHRLLCRRNWASSGRAGRFLTVGAGHT